MASNFKRSPQGASTLDEVNDILRGGELKSDPLRPVRSIVGNTKRIIVSQVLLPSLKRLKDRENNGYFHLSKEQFFNIINDIEKKEENTLIPPFARVMEELGSTIGALGGTIARGGQRFKNFLGLSNEGQEEDGQEKQELPDEDKSEDEIRFNECKELFWGTMCELFTIDEEKGVKTSELIALCNGCSVSPVATRRQREIIIRELDKFRLDDVVTRNEFIVMIRKWAQKIGNEELNEIDFEPYTLYLFPDMHMQIRVLRHLVYKTGSPSEHHAFASSYAKIKTVQAKDMTEFLWYLPFVIIYLIVAMAGKGLNPRAYHGFNINKAFTDIVYSGDFQNGCTRSYDSNMVLTKTCSSDDKITFADIADASDTYGFLHDHLLPSLWPESGVSAGNNTIGALRLVGGLKLRAMRVEAESDSDASKDYYFGTTNTTYKRFPAFSSSTQSDARDTRMDEVNLTSVLHPWTGAAFGTCKGLNGSGTILGDALEYPCDGHAIVIPFNTSLNEAQHTIFQLEGINGGEGWIDVKTRAVLVELMLFHPVTTMMLQERMAIEFHPGGGVTTKFISRPFQFFTLASNKASVEALYIVFIMYLFVLILRLIFRTAFGVTLNKRLGRKWLILDVTQYGIFLAHFILRAGWMGFGGPEDPMWQQDHYPYFYEETARIFTTLLNLDSFNLILIVLTAFRFTKYIPGLDVVVNTLQRSMYDAAAIAFVTIGVMLSFVLCAHSVYGTTLFGYHTIGYSLESLGVSFLGEFDFWPLWEEHPSFSYLFFVIFQLIIVAVLLNMVIAVFADAFGAEQEESFNVKNAVSIMENNTFHSLNRTTLTTVINQYYLFQNLKAKIGRVIDFFTGREDLFRYDTYHMQLMMDVRRLLIPLFVLGREGEIEDYEVDWRNRVISATNLISLVDGYLKAPKFLPNRRLDANLGTSVYAYFEDVFGTYDYTLVMAFYVLIPQNKFNIPGDNAILEAAATHRKWELKATNKTMKGDDVDEVNLRVHATMEERKIISGQAHQNLEEEEEVPLTPTMKFVSTMDHVSRRTLLGLMAFVEEPEKQRSLSPKLLAQLVERHEQTKKLEIDAAAVFSQLNLDVEGAPRLKVNELHTAFLHEFAPQALAFHWTYDRVDRLEDYLADKKLGSCPNSFDADSTDLATSATVAISDGDDLNYTQEEFEAAWEVADGFKPSKTTMDRIRSIYPNKISMVEFLLHCRGNPRAHNSRSFGYQFAIDLRQGTEFLLWLVFYIPFFILIIFFLLYGYQLGNSIHVTRAMRAAFAAPDATNLGDVKKYLTDTVDTMWSHGPNRSAGLFRRSNFFIGALRIRQKKVKSEPTERCERNFENYIGDFDLQRINYPEYIEKDEVSKAFYSETVRNNYGFLFEARCYGAFDFGIQEDEEDIQPTTANYTIANLTARAKHAFQFKSDGDNEVNDAVEAHDAIYGRGGYALVLPFSLTTQEARASLDEVLNNGWLDEKSRLVIVEFFSFNYNLKLIGKNRFGYEITGGGSLQLIDELAVFGSESIQGGGFLAVSIIFIMLLCIYAIIFSVGLGKAFMVRRHYYGDNVLSSLVYGLFSKWTLTVDMIIIVTLAASWIMRAMNVSNNHIETLRNEDGYPANLEDVALTSQNIRKIEGTNIFFTFIRVLYFFNFNKRIGLLFDTLAHASRDLVSIGTLFLLSLCAFALGGYVLFGYSVEVYFNFQKALFDLFITATGGNPSYPDMAAARPQAAAIFNLFFVVVGIYVLYNMVIAVLTDSFSEVKDEIFDDSVAKSVIKQEAGSLWYPKVKTADKIKHFLRHNVIINEIVHAFNFIAFKGQLPFYVANKNPRVLWTNMADWFGQLDTGLPIDAVIGGLQILRLVNFDPQEYAERMRREKEDAANGVVSETPAKTTAKDDANEDSNKSDFSATAATDSKPTTDAEKPAATEEEKKNDNNASSEETPVTAIDDKKDDQDANANSNAVEETPVTPIDTAENSPNEKKEQDAPSDGAQEESQKDADAEPAAEKKEEAGDSTKVVDGVELPPKRKDSLEWSHDLPPPLAKDPTASPPPKLESIVANMMDKKDDDEERDPQSPEMNANVRAIVERKVMVDMGKKLRTYSNRRLPMWEEYIYYKFKGDKEEVLRYLVQTPSKYISVPEHSLWMSALESFHYFNSEKELYNVDVSSRLEEIYNNLPDVNEMKLLAETAEASVRPQGGKW